MLVQFDKTNTQRSPCSKSDEGKLQKKQQQNSHKRNLYERLKKILKLFAVSGILHEYIFFVLMRAVTFEQVLFFVLNGALVAFEFWIKVHYPAFVKSIPAVVKICLTSLVVTASSWFFFMPYVRHGILDAALIPYPFSMAYFVWDK